MSERVLHVMVDVETLANTPDSAIVQLAAVAFCPETGVVEGTFNQYVSDLVGRVDPQTVAWWLQQSGAALLGAGMQGKSPALDHDRAGVGPCATVLLRFDQWFLDLRLFTGRDVVAVWSHGATFDLPVIESAYVAVRGVGAKPPWYYRTPRDTRTLYELAGGMPEVPEPADFVKHDALSDARLQAAQVVAALAVLREQRADAARWRGGDVAVDVETTEG